jgi:hypothetical protein
MSILHYISATRRLKESQKTVDMMRTNEYTDEGIPDMVLAQRDFIKKEKEYFYVEAQKTVAFILASK